MNRIKRIKFNISLLGESQVGKTSIVSIISGLEFDSHTLSTIGIDDYIDSAVFNGKEYKFKIFDTAGQEQYRSISTSIIQASDGFLLVFAINDKKSFEHISDWIGFIQNSVDIKKKVLFLVGNKNDLVDIREVTKEEAEQFAYKRKMKYFETSAKVGKGIKDIFKCLYEDVYQKNEISESTSDDINNKSEHENKFVLETEGKKKKKHSCC